MISIAMTSYNGEKYISQQIESILNQDYLDFELVICDDCSMDSTKDILDHYSAKDSRIRVYYNNENLGFKRNFEKSISLCKGDYIALSDQDDIWNKSHLSMLLSCIGSNYLVCGNSFCFDTKHGISGGGFLLSELEQNLYLIKDSLTNVKRILFKGNPYQGASMLLSKDFIDIVLPIPDEIPFHDVWFALVASCYNSFVYTNEVVTNYRQHNDSITKRSKKSFLSKILKFPRYSANLNNRYLYSKQLEMLSSNKNKMDDETINLISEASNFFSKIDNRFNRLKYYPYYIKSIFYCLYGETSLSNRLSRHLQFLFF